MSYKEHFHPRILKHETMHFRAMDSTTKGRWSADDQHYLLLHCKDTYVEDIAKQLDRTVKAVKAKAFQMGCSFKSKPTVSDK